MRFSIRVIWTYVSYYYPAAYIFCDDVSVQVVVWKMKGCFPTIFGYLMFIALDVLAIGYNR